MEIVTLMKRKFSRVVTVAVQVCCGDCNQEVVVGLIRSLRVFVVSHSCAVVVVVVVAAAVVVVVVVVADAKTGEYVFQRFL